MHISSDRNNRIRGSAGESLRQAHLLKNNGHSRKTSPKPAFAPGLFPARKQFAPEILEAYELLILNFQKIAAKVGKKVLVTQPTHFLGVNPEIRSRHRDRKTRTFFGRKISKTKKNFGLKVFRPDFFRFEK